MKKLFFLISICTSLIGVAQNLESKIPNNSQAVMAINGNRILELMSIEQFEESDLAKEFFKEINRKKDSTARITSLKDFGIDTNSKAYYFYQVTDSISYHHFILKLSDKRLYENLLSESDKEEIKHKEDVNILTEYSSITMWNDNMLLFTGFNESAQYFTNNEERLLKQAENEDESIYSIRNRVGKSWAKDHAFAIFNSKGSNSILEKSSYTKRKDNKATASFWVSNYGELINNTMKHSLASLFKNRDMDVSKTGYGVDGMWGNLYLEDDGARITANMEINDTWKKTYKKMYKSKIGNEFFANFDQNNVLAYTSMSFNMQGMLEEYPTIVSNVYGGMVPKYREETEVAAEIISVLLDEEAIGNVLTGNMLFILNDISEKEVAYTTYEYDDDYNKTEVTNTKTEPVPDFTIMIGSKNKKLMNKLIRLGAKYELVNPKVNYFKLKKEKKIPFDVFFAIKSDIAFFTTSEKQISDILNNRVISNAGKHKKMIRNNISAFYINGKQLLHKIPDNVFSEKERSFLNFARENLSNAYFTTSRMKGNKIHMEFKMDTPIKHGNSLKFFLNFIEMTIK